MVGAMSDPVVTINQGKLKGKTVNDVRGNVYFSFQGIPYAKPPVGPLRFKAPEKHDGWSDILDATIEGSPCYQVHLFTKNVVGSEDCLYLNVYTPVLPNSHSNKKKPVMVWIHGGAFENGSNKTEIYGPDFLMTEDIVLVSINYRLGVFGFLSLDDPSVEATGNAAFKDMILALEWVKENISEFNGNPDNVTIFGESAGGVATHLLMLSPLGKNLFHKVIAQSGCALNIWAAGQTFGVDFAKSMGFQSSDQHEILKFLQNVPAEDIFANQSTISKVNFQANKKSDLGVVIEDPSTKRAFMTVPPLEILKSGLYNKVPLLIGYTNKEGFLFDLMSTTDHLDLLLTDFETSVPNTLEIETGSDLSKEIGNRIKKFYFNKDKLTKEEDMDIFYDLVGDNCFLRDILRTTRYHTQTSSQPVYLYRMSIETELNFIKKLMHKETPGVSHGDDLGYLFKNILTPDIEEGSMEDVAQRRFARMWANFARYGNPNSPKEDPLLPVVWNPVSKNDLDFLDIGTELVMGKNPAQDRMSFWEDIFARSPIHSSKL